MSGFDWNQYLQKDKLIILKMQIKKLSQNLAIANVEKLSEQNLKIVALDKVEFLVLVDKNMPTKYEFIK